MHFGPLRGPLPPIPDPSPSAVSQGFEIRPAFAITRDGISRRDGYDVLEDGAPIHRWKTKRQAEDHVTRLRLELE